MTDPRIEALYRAGVGARRPTAAQAAMMDRMMRDLESFPESTISDLDAAATEIAPDPEVRPYYGRRHGMPAGMDGTPAQMGAEFASPEEAAEYTISGRDPDTGARTPSPFAQDMRSAHDLLQVATPDGPAFMSSGEVPPMHIDGMINPRYLRYQQMVQGYGGKPAMWESVTDPSLTTPEGASATVLRPSEKNRDRMTGFERRQRRARMGKRLLREADRAGIEVDEDDVFTANADSVAEMRMRAQAAAESSLRQQRMFAGGAQNLNAGNVSQIRELIRLRDTDPETYNAMLAENMRPRNFQYRIDPRTGGVSYAEETAYAPPEPPQDGRAVMAMMQQQAAQDMMRREREQVMVDARAAASDYRRWRNTRQQAYGKMIRLGRYPEEVINAVLDAEYGPAGAELPPPAPATVDPSRTTVPMPGPSGGGDGMGYQYRY
jgi:hypothetical protein